MITAAGGMSETQYLRRIMMTAHHYDWLCTHVKVVRMPSGQFVTPYEGDTGLPDLILSHPEHGVLLREVKTDTGRVQKSQVKWIAYGARVWRPRDWDDVVLPELRGELPLLVADEVDPELGERFV